MYRENVRLVTDRWGRFQHVNNKQRSLTWLSTKHRRAWNWNNTKTSYIPQIYTRAQKERKSRRKWARGMGNLSWVSLLWTNTKYVITLCYLPPDTSNYNPPVMWCPHGNNAKKVTISWWSWQDSDRRGGAKLNSSQKWQTWHNKIRWRKVRLAPWKYASIHDKIWTTYFFWKKTQQLSSFVSEKKQFLFCQIK